MFPDVYQSLPPDHPSNQLAPLVGNNCLPGLGGAGVGVSVGSGVGVGSEVLPPCVVLLFDAGGASDETLPEFPEGMSMGERGIERINIPKNTIVEIKANLRSCGYRPQIGLTIVTIPLIRLIAAIKPDKRFTYSSFIHAH
jgi:hypothetical protein